MKRIQAAVSMTGAKCFRTNVGTGWTGDRIRHNPDGSLTIFEPRPFMTGLPRGYPDLTAFCPGRHVALLEVKTAKGKVSDDQSKFANVLEPLGFEVATVRTIEEALNACRPP